MTDNWYSYKGILNPWQRTRSATSIVFTTSMGQPCSCPPAALLPASVAHDRYTDLLTVTPGPPKPVPPLPKQTASTIPGLLLADTYYSSFYHHYQFPDNGVYVAITRECSSGISVLHRSYYDTQGISYGWMIYSSSLTTILDTVEVSWGLVPNVSSMRRTELEALLNAIALIACIHKCNYVTKGKSMCIAYQKLQLVSCMVSYTIVFLQL
jgi:hypothetical protein